MRSVFLPFALAVALPAQTGIVISDFPTTYVYQAYPGTTSDNGGRSGFSSGSGNHLAQNWWYYCVSGDTSGSAFNTGGSQMTETLSADRKTGTLEWTNVDGRAFAAKLVNCVYRVTSTSGVSAQTMTITNNTAAPLTITVYSYADLDLEGFGGDDSAVQVAGQPAGQTFVTDTTGRCYFMGQGHNGWETDAWPLLRDRVIAGVGGQCYALRNQGLPFGPGDWTGMFSWTATIPVAGSASFRALLSITFQPPSAAAASATLFGAPKAGTPGLPEWTLNRPFAGSTATLEIRNGLAGSAPLLLVGSTQINLPFPPFGTVYVVPLASVSMPAFSGAGLSSVRVAIPPVASGSALFQALWGDPGAAGGVAHTDGLNWTLGSF